MRPDASNRWKFVAVLNGAPSTVPPSCGSRQLQKAKTRCAVQSNTVSGHDATTKVRTTGCMDVDDGRPSCAR